MSDKRPKSPTPKQYERSVASQALSFCPPIRPCKKCGWAVVDGYCCQYCGTSTPELTDEQEREYDNE